MNTYYGGLDIDKNGNIVAISAFDSNVYVYSGCNPACTLVGGPFPMHGEAVFGHLNKQSMTFALATSPTARSTSTTTARARSRIGTASTTVSAQATTRKAVRSTRVPLSNTSED